MASRPALDMSPPRTPLGVPGTACLLCVDRPFAGCDALVVGFNGYLNAQSFAQAGNPGATRFEMMRRLMPYRAHALWFAQSAPNWYLEPAPAILATLVETVITRALGRVALIGSSAGGYASLRFGMLLSRALAGRDHHATVTALALNPQTGFGDAVLARVTAAAAHDPATAAALGYNPLLLAPNDRARFAGAGIDLAVLAAAGPCSGFAGFVLYDHANCIDAAFAAELRDIPAITPVPLDLGLPHGEGCIALYRDHFDKVFKALCPIPTTNDPPEALTVTQHIVAG